MIVPKGRLKIASQFIGWNELKQQYPSPAMDD